MFQCGQWCGGGGIPTSGDTRLGWLGQGAKVMGRWAKGPGREPNGKYSSNSQVFGNSDLLRFVSKFLHFDSIFLDFYDTFGESWRFNVFLVVLFEILSF